MTQRHALEVQQYEDSTLDESGVVRRHYPVFRDQVPPGELVAGRYALRFASSEEDLRMVQRLRFEVFNLELEEGLDSAYLLGRDEDEFDATCHHLMVIHRKSNRVVGTYRFMTGEMAAARGGFYSSTEFEFAALPGDVQMKAAEIGRACVHADHRNGRVIHMLWKGLARYLSWNEKRYLFGCASVPSMDPAVGYMLLDQFHARGQMHESIRLAPLPALRCEDRVSQGDLATEVPPLLQSYLSLGAKVCSDPALDQAFKVIDFFVVLDLNDLSDGVRKSFFGGKAVWQ